MYDEPTAGLDPVASTVVEDLIRSLQSRRDAGPMTEGISSYIVVTHQHSTIRRAVDRLVFLHEVFDLPSTSVQADECWPLYLPYCQSLQIHAERWMFVSFLLPKLANKCQRPVCHPQ